MPISSLPIRVHEFDRLSLSGDYALLKDHAAHCQDKAGLDQ